MSTKSDPLSPGYVAAGRYEVLGLIGTGGMGAVYEAVDKNLDKPVALKTLDPLLVSEKDAMRRFRQEAQSAARIKHDNVCDVTDFGVTDAGVPFLVMELLAGEPLTGFLRRQGKLRPKRAVAIMRQVVSALGSAHTAGIVHRDLKPDNIFLTRSSKGDERVKLIDFGLAKVIDATSTGTATGRLLGTLAYMSPEQANGQSDLIDHTTDIWSAGVILYQMLAGQPPFGGETMREILAAVVIKEPPPVHEVVAEIPVALSDVVATALRKEQDERFVDMDDFEVALEQALEPPVAPVEPAVAKSSSRWPLAALAILLLCGGVFAAWWLYGAAPDTTQTSLPPVDAGAAVAPAGQAPATAVAPVADAVLAVATPVDAAPTVAADGGTPPVPEPEPAEVEVAITGLPAGARVTFDGRDVSETMLLRGAPGQRGELRVHARGYRELSEEVALPASGALELGSKLRPIDPPAVTTAPVEPTEPAGATREPSSPVASEERARPRTPRTRPAKRGRLVGGYDDG